MSGEPTLKYEDLKAYRQVIMGDEQFAEASGSCLGPGR
jgi:hypothetical protein